ncbi:MATE family efflux transporter, partial [Clostridium sp.]
LMVMYAYGQTSLNFISEDLGKNDIENLKRIPKECEFMALVFYMVFGCIFIIYRRYLASLLSNDTILILEVIRYIPMVIVINIFNLINTILKYSLQAIGKSKWVFNISLLLNMILFIGVFISIRLIGNKIIFVYIGLFIYYVILSMVFKKKYYKSLEEVA